MAEDMIMTGIAAFDEIYGGIERGSLSILAGRPSMGKTAFALTLANNLAVQHDKICIYFSIEMSREQFVKRLFMMNLPFDNNYEVITKGNVTNEQWDILVRVANKIGDSKLIVDDSIGLSVSEIVDRSCKYACDYGKPSLIIIDYLQLLTERTDNDALEGKRDIYSLKAIKELAVNLSVPILLIVQTAHAPAQRKDKRSHKEDISCGESAIENADEILFLYRDEYYYPDSRKSGIAEINNLDCKNMQEGTIEVVFDKKTCSFL